MVYVHMHAQVRACAYAFCITFSLVHVEKPMQEYDVYMHACASLSMCSLSMCVLYAPKYVYIRLDTKIVE